MQYLVEMRLAEAERAPTPREGLAFIERYLLPTLEMCRQLEAEQRIVAGGPIDGPAGVAFIVRAESASEVEDIIAHLPLWPRMVTTVTPLETWADHAARLGSRAERLRRGLIPGHVLVK